ncbi:MAG TPA: LysR family transcriptional regulator [Acetobacteraceae bacterium]|nr:LysR family transcriptional regulator [Acetobacteraceae bacterium]
MDRLRRIEMLIHAAETGSFTRAAEALGLTPSAVSHGIAELEDQLRATLFHRTTRNLRLTEAGMEAYRGAREVVDRLGVFEATGHTDPGGPLTGTLRVGVVGPIHRLILMPRITAFLRGHPELRLEFVTPTRPLELEAGGMDVLLRIGPLPDSRLVARRLAVLRLTPCAAPAYLAERGEPREPEDLLRHRCLVHRPPFQPKPLDDWLFERAADGARRRIKVAAALTTDDRDGMLAAVLAGAGIMRIGLFDPGLLTSGALQRVLPGWTCPGGPALYALYRRTPRAVPKVTAFLAFAAQAVADFDPEGATLAPTRR